MPPLALCTCRSHCAKYDAKTNTYAGGQMVTRFTRFEHRKDDNRTEDLNTFATEVATTILDEGSHLGLSRGLGDPSTHSPLSREALPRELMTIETEIRGRITWAPTNWSLVFASYPLSDRDFEDPLLAPNYVPNDGPHALSESHQRNLAFIENENRLFEITIHLNTITHFPEQCNALAELVIQGLQGMMRHKKRKWDRQRMETTAIANGFVVVRTGSAYCNHFSNLLILMDVQRNTWQTRFHVNHPSLLPCWQCCSCTSSFTSPAEPLW